MNGKFIIIPYCSEGKTSKEIKVWDLEKMMDLNESGSDASSFFVRSIQLGTLKLDICNTIVCDDRAVVLIGQIVCIKILQFRFTY